MVNKNWNQPNGKTIPFEWYQISSKTQLYNNKIGGNNNMYFHGRSEERRVGKEC